MLYKVCIPAAGTGSRLGDMTRFINKSLVAIAHRPAICHIIEKFPKDIICVVALGFKGELVREFLELAYPDRIFEYEQVSPFEGPGSGLGLSLLACKPRLQQPFIFISCDTLVAEHIQTPSRNWIGYSEDKNVGSYRAISIENNKAKHIHEKNNIAEELLYPYIGLAGIYDYEKFWQAMSLGGCQAIDEGEVYGLRNLLESGMDSIQFTWHDTGNLDSLRSAKDFYRQENEPNILDKPNEAIWFVNNDVIKYSDNLEFIKKRVARANELKGFIPEITGSGLNMYRYRKVDGHVFSEIVNLPRFKSLLEYSQSFWKIVELSGDKKLEFKASCKKFYLDKTIERINLFYKNSPYSDDGEMINGVKYPSLGAILNEVDWEWLANGRSGRFHGDFHFENILWIEASGKFSFLDWRQDFSDSLSIGDIYYDLAKLMHGLIISHEIIARGLYSANWNDGCIDFDFNRKEKLIECERYFIEWLKNNGYDVKKVRTLTALIFLNIAVLHHHPYSILLYALGKKMLFEEICPNANN